mgnify:CR=1 FL=1
MIVTWLIIALVLAIIIARLNQSNKLFWIAFTSFAVGIAIESVINKVDQSKEDLTRAYPTQVVVETPNCYSFLADVPTTDQSLVPNPASQDTTPEASEGNFALSDVHKDVATEPPDPKIKLQ